MIGMEPTLGQELPPTTGELGVRPDDSGEFEAVLEDLLDSETEQGEFAFLIFPPALTSAPMPQGSREYLFSPVVGEGLKGTASPLWFYGVHDIPDFSAPTPLSLHSVNGEETTSFSHVPIPPSLLTESTLGGEFEISDAEVQVQANGDLDSEVVLLVESRQQVELFTPLQGDENPAVLGGDFEQSVLEALSLASDALPPSNGDKGVSPVSSARQGETPSSLLLTDRETAVLAARGMERTSESHRAVQGQDDSRDHTPHVSALHHAPTTYSTAHTEPSYAVQSAQPDWGAVEQVARHIERMVYNREHDSITVRLDPPELGVIELRIQASGGEVQAWVSAERDLTRQLLQQTQQQLREQLESRGLQLTHFDVGGQSNPHFAQARPFRTPATTINTTTHPSTATDSLSYYDGRWSVWV